jgi:hypothetical protein
MSSQHSITFPARLLRRAASWALLILALEFIVFPARAAAEVSTGRPSAPMVSALAGAGSTAAPLAWSWDLDRVWNFLEHALGNRRRLIQVATVMMCIALYVMFRARG